MRYLRTLKPFIATAALRVLLVMAAGLGGLRAIVGAPASDTSPTVLVREAPLLQFPGANRPAGGKPGETDCNSPGHWDGATLYVFNSAGHPWRSTGTDIAHLDQSYSRCEYDNKVNGGRWIECTWKDDEATLFGWYHNEPAGLCPGTTLTAPKIGAIRSTDNGAHWQDLGIILEAPPHTLDCTTKNFYFAGGNGDFSVMADGTRTYLYFFISTYTGGLEEQGVSVARMLYGDRDKPVGKVFKWHGGQWIEPGIGGHVTAVFPATVSWHQPAADAFWGPSIHWNSYLRQFVLLLNRTKDSNWTQEGIYASFNPDLAQPTRWTLPQKIVQPQAKDQWYPQVFGTNAPLHETDKLASRNARLFVRGQSMWELEFRRPDE